MYDNLPRDCSYRGVVRYLPSGHVVRTGIYFHTGVIRFVFRDHAERSVYQEQVDVVQLQVFQRFLHNSVHVTGTVRVGRKLQQKRNSR